MQLNTKDTRPTAVRDVRGLAVRTNLKAGKLAANHNQTKGLVVRTSLKAGKLSANHNQSKR